MRERLSLSFNTICFFLLLLISVDASAQGFLVRPMSIEFSPKPGERLRVPVKITNTKDVPYGLEVLLVELTQNSDGNLSTIERKEGVPGKEDSCVPWIRKNFNELELAPAQQGEIQLDFTIPSGVSGFYMAALVIQNKIDNSNPTGISLVVRFTIPILINVVGRPGLTKVDVVDSGILSEENLDKNIKEEKSFITLNNTGKTMAQIDGSVTILNLLQDKWRRVTDIQLGSHKIIPGASITVIAPILRRIPTGKYRLDTQISIDKKAQPVKRKEIDFVGDPSISSIATDAPLSIEPARIEIEGINNARRSGYITVNNLGEDLVLISLSFSQPAELKNIAMGEIKGDDFTCHEWLKSMPDSFQLQPGKSRKISIQASLPDLMVKPYYYSSLKINATYADGQYAGGLNTMVIIKNSKGEPHSQLEPFGITLNKENEDLYSVIGKYGNKGNIHLQPVVTGSITDMGQIKKYQQFELNSDQNLILPLGTPKYAGSIDIKKLDPGLYVLTLSATIQKDVVDQKIAFEIAMESNEKNIKIIDMPK